MSDETRLEPEARAESEETTKGAPSVSESAAPTERPAESGGAPPERRRPPAGSGQGGERSGRDSRDDSRSGPPRDSRDSRDDSRSGPPRGRGRDGRPRFRSFYRRKVCKFCTRKVTISYRDTDGLRRFITDRGKILPRRVTGTCPKHQRALSKAIKQARVLALLPFVEK